MLRPARPWYEQRREEHNCCKEKSQQYRTAINTHIPAAVTATLILPTPSPAGSVSDLQHPASKQADPSPYRLLSFLSSPAPDSRADIDSKLRESAHRLGKGKGNTDSRRTRSEACTTTAPHRTAPGKWECSLLAICILVFVLTYQPVAGRQSREHTHSTMSQPSASRSGVEHPQSPSVVRVRDRTVGGGSGRACTFVSSHPRAFQQQGCTVGCRE